jgi:hypothetical protein
MKNSICCTKDCERSVESPGDSFCTRCLIAILRRRLRRAKSDLALEDLEDGLTQ